MTLNSVLALPGYLWNWISPIWNSLFSSWAIWESRRQQNVKWNKLDMHAVLELVQWVNRLFIRGTWSISESLQFWLPKKIYFPNVCFLVSNWGSDSELTYHITKMQRTTFLTFRIKFRFSKGCKIRTLLRSRKQPGLVVETRIYLAQNNTSKNDVAHFLKFTEPSDKLCQLIAVHTTRACTYLQIVAPTGH